MAEGAEFRVAASQGVSIGENRNWEPLQGRHGPQGRYTGPYSAVNSYAMIFHWPPSLAHSNVIAAGCSPGVRSTKRVA